MRRLGGKPAKTEGDVDAAAKERPKEAPFAALRPHDYRLRTWSRVPTAKPTRPKKEHHHQYAADDDVLPEKIRKRKSQRDGDFCRITHLGLLGIVVCFFVFSFDDEVARKKSQ